MKWAMYLKTDAVLTNDPEKYLALRNHLSTEPDQPDNWSLRNQWSLYFWKWYGFVMMSLRVWRFSEPRSWKERSGDVQEKAVKGEGENSEKLQENS